MSLLHIPNDKISKKKQKIEQSIRNINYGINNAKPSIGNFELWQTNNSYFIGEIRIEIPNENITNKEEKENLENKLDIKNTTFFEIQSKIQGIFKENKINEYYIEIL